MHATAADVNRVAVGDGVDATRSAGSLIEDGATPTAADPMSAEEWQDVWCTASMAKDMIKKYTHDIVVPCLAQEFTAAEQVSWREGSVQSLL